MYPFAGREAARALALMSVEPKDCSDDLTGVGKMELDTLREWQAKFNSKYPIVGTVVKEAGAAAAVST
jgi:membrane-associated progesterone receptor component